MRFVFYTTIAALIVIATSVDKADAKVKRPPRYQREAQQYRSSDQAYSHCGQRCFWSAWGILHFQNARFGGLTLAAGSGFDDQKRGPKRRMRDDPRHWLTPAFLKTSKDVAQVRLQVPCSA